MITSLLLLLQVQAVTWTARHETGIAGTRAYDRSMVQVDGATLTLKSGPLSAGANGPVMAEGTYTIDAKGNFPGLGIHQVFAVFSYKAEFEGATRVCNEVDFSELSCWGDEGRRAWLSTGALCFKAPGSQIPVAYTAQAPMLGFRAYRWVITAERARTYVHIYGIRAQGQPNEVAYWDCPFSALGQTLKVSLWTMDVQSPVVSAETITVSGSFVPAR